MHSIVNFYMRPLTALSDRVFLVYMSAVYEMVYYHVMVFSAEYRAL